METRDLTFHVAPGKEIPMPLMSKDDVEFPYSFSDDLKCHCVQLPFKSEDLSLFVIVPEERFGLTAVESKLASKPGQLRELVQNVTKTELGALLIPRFTITSQFDLETQLPKLGIKTLFDRGSCDLSGERATTWTRCRGDRFFLLSVCLLIAAVDLCCVWSPRWGRVFDIFTACCGRCVLKYRSYSFLSWLRGIIMLLESNGFITASRRFLHWWIAVLDARITLKSKS